jgi:signal transduction histidine kinase
MVGFGFAPGWMPILAGRSMVGEVTWRQRFFEDIVQPETPTGREELVFLICAAVAIVVTAQLSDPGSLAELAVVSIAVLGFVLRGLLPAMPAELFAALVLVPVALAIGNVGDLEVTLFLSAIMVLYVAWHLGSVTRALLIGVTAAYVPFALSKWLAPEEQIAWTPWVSATVFTFALGRVLRRQQALIHQLERAREALAVQAVAEERRRIARELHDLAGHTLAAMLLHVTGARHVLRRDLDEAERALLDAESIGRSSLDQIRNTVAALRTHERGTDVAVVTSADFSDLIDEYRRAGLIISAATSGPLSGLDGSIGTGLHRIAREALANIARHAPKNSTEITLEVVADEVRLVVADRGRPAPTPDPDAGHFGLVGMRERARALGGEFSARPTVDGWIVEARLPLAPRVIEGLVGR